VCVPSDLVAGRYRIVREVGRGGMGSVYLCTDERLGREVALKQVGGLPGESSMHLARALREARHSAALNHPNVVAMYDAIEEGDHVWLVMEYVPSRTLDQLVRGDGPLAPERAARIGAQVADGLATAHALGTVHRDVKPSNILVREDDSRALIADFGIARSVGDEQLTRSGLVTGTPTYFSPELARGAEPSPASDVWALGASLYLAVEGRPPYAEQSNAIALLNVIASEPPPAPELAGPLTEPILRMMDVDLTRRWSMAEAATALRAIADGSAPASSSEADEPTGSTLLMPAPVPPVPPVTPEPEVERTAERLVPVAPQAPVELPAEEPPEHRRRAAPWVLAALLVLVLAVAGGWWLSRDTDEPAADTASDSPKERPSKTRQPDRDQSPSASPPASESVAPEPSEPASPSSSAPEDDDAAPVATSGATEFVADYYSVLPEDTETGWQMLSPELQNEIGRGTYDGFWATIDDVQVDDVASDGDGAVLATITYVTDGRSEQETRRLLVGEGGGGLLITDDQGAV
jgi:serine/threonine protein kinase